MLVKNPVTWPCQSQKRGSIKTFIEISDLDFSRAIQDLFFHILVRLGLIGGGTTQHKIPQF